MGMVEEAGRWPEQKPYEQPVLIGLYAAFGSLGLYAVARYRRRWLPLWLGALAVWGTLCKYLICTRCERFGQACDYCYGGKYAELFFRKQPERSLGPGGFAAEGISTSLMVALPALAALRRPRLLGAYLALLAASQGWLLKVCCVKCARHATDEWKKYCPNYHIAGRYLAA